VIFLAPPDSNRGAAILLLYFVDLCPSSAQWSIIPLNGKEIDVLARDDILT
jgi:hypothetical protein